MDPAPAPYDASRIEVRVVDVYPYRERRRGIEFLVMRRATGRLYEGEWRMVGGKIEPGETMVQAAVRELREETARAPELLWALPSANIFTAWERDAVQVAPAFAVRLRADPALNDEHDAFDWCAAEVAAERMTWPEPQRLLRLTARLLEAGPIPPELIVSPHRWR